MSTQAVREYLQHVWAQYQKALRPERTAIIDEVCRNLQLHRKSAIRMLNKRYAPRSMQGFAGGRPKQYSKQAKFHLERLWRLMGFMGPVRMKAALPEWLPFDDHSDCDETLKAELISMSESSIHRFLKKARSELRRKMNCGTRPGVRRYVAEVPIRNLGETPTELGHVEIDCVAHCGGSLSGQFVWSLTLTDIRSGWTECEAMWGKTGAGVRVALTNIENRLPFALKALYSDNGSEFMNQEVLNTFAKKDRKIELPVFRGRPYRKNDQCYVEQKNYTHIRHLFGYGRIDLELAPKLMNDIYRKEWSKLQNYFCPQQKLLSKQRHGSKIKRKMSAPETPFQRILTLLPEENVRALIERKKILNPFRLRFNQRVKARGIFGHFQFEIDKTEWGKMVL